MLDPEDGKKYNLLPFINKAFACTWVFADSLLFVGMINPQNSPLNENVVTVWYYIFLCRAFQFAATFFMDSILLEVEPKRHESNIVVACCQLCSLWSFFIVVLHFQISFGLTSGINGMGFGQTYGLQVAFILAMAMMEVVRHLLVFWRILWGVNIPSYQTYAQLIYLSDCVLRTVFIISASSVVSTHLGEQNLLLYNYLKA